MIIPERNGSQLGNIVPYCTCQSEDQPCQHIKTQGYRMK